MNFLEDRGKRPPDKELLDKGKEAYELIKKTLLSNLTTTGRTYEH